MTFVVFDNAAARPLVAQAAKAGYNVNDDGYLYFGGHNGPVPRLSDGFGIRRIRSEEHWAMLQRFNDRESRDKDWYDPAATADPLSARYT